MSQPLSVDEMRRMVDNFAPLMNADLPEVGTFHEAVPVREGVTADVVVPRGKGPHPVLVYLHGGGWVCGSAKSHRKLGYRFAKAGYLVFNVDYRLQRWIRPPRPPASPTNTSSTRGCRTAMCRWSTCRRRDRPSSEWWRS